MVFLMAFIVGGLLCALFEAISQATKVAPPVLLTIGVALGALFGALGLADALTGVAGAGYGVMVIGFGSAVFGAASQAIAGQWLGVGILVGVVVILTVIGLVCGAGHRARAASDPGQAPAIEGEVAGRR